MSERLLELRYSDNGGRDWTNWRSRSMGAPTGVVYAYNPATLAGVGALSISGSPPPGRAGDPYAFGFTVTGGVAPVSVEISGSAPGLSIIGSTISGTPTEAGLYSFTVTATDSVGATANLSVQIFIQERVSPPVDPGDPGDPEFEPYAAVGEFPAGVNGDLYSWANKTGITFTGGREFYRNRLKITGLPALMTLLRNTDSYESGGNTELRIKGLGVEGVYPITCRYGQLDEGSYVGTALFVDKTITVASGSGTDLVPCLWDSKTLPDSLRLDGDDGFLVTGHQVSGWQIISGQATAKAIGAKSSGKWRFESQKVAGFEDRVWLGLCLDSFDNSAHGLPVGKRAGTYGVNVQKTFDSAEIWFNNTLAATVPLIGLEVVTFALDMDANTLKVYVGGVLAHTFNGVAAGAWVPATSCDAAGSVVMRGTGLTHAIAGYSDWTL